MIVHSVNASDLHDVAVVLLRRAERAVLLKRFAFRDHADEQPVWFPLSLVELMDNGADGANGTRSHTLTCPEWKLKQEGWL